MEFDGGLSFDEILMETGGRGVDSNWGELGRELRLREEVRVDVVRLLAE